MDNTEIAERIKSTAKNTDALIAKLDTLSSRIDAAKSGGNDELAQYYENQFTEASVEFMDGVETILDSWYEMRGVKRPPAESEELSVETLDEIHSLVVNIMQGGVPQLPQHTAPRAEVQTDVRHMPTQQQQPTQPNLGKAPKHKVDLTG